jgi:CRISPR-associated protein Csb2
MPTHQEWQIYQLFPCTAGIAIYGRSGHLIASADFAGSTNPNVARYKITSQLPPSVMQTVRIGEMARRALQAIYGTHREGGSSKIFSGKDVNGTPMTGHRHAFFLPTDEDGDSRLDHLTVFSQAPFGSTELLTLQHLTSIRGKEGFADIDVVLTDCGDMHTMRHVPLISQSRVWRSVTPFIPTRHYKRRGQKRDTCDLEDFLEVVLQEEITRRGLSGPKQIRRLPRCEMWDYREKRLSVGPPLSWLRFQRERAFGNGRKGNDRGCGFEIEFHEPVQGPLAMGYGCHFGLGLFAPVD